MSSLRRANSFLSRRTKLYQAPTRLLAERREYEAAVLRAEARAWETLGLV
jgi:hypothetical protein